jgi:hypothetical protein
MRVGDSFARRHCWSASAWWARPGRRHRAFYGVMEATDPDRLRSRGWAPKGQYAANQLVRARFSPSKLSAFHEPPRRDHRRWPSRIRAPTVYSTALGRARTTSRWRRSPASSDLRARGGCSIREQRQLDEQPGAPEAAEHHCSLERMTRQLLVPQAEREQYVSLLKVFRRHQGRRPSARAAWLFRTPRVKNGIHRTATCRRSTGRRARSTSTRRPCIRTRRPRKTR